MNQSGIGPSKNIIGFNLPQNKKEEENQREEYEKLAKKRDSLMDLMNKMQFDKILINNNNNNSKIKNDNNNDDIDLPPENVNSPNKISPLGQISRSNTNKFDDKLLESQAFAPEKLEQLGIDDISAPGDDEFNINFEQEESKVNDEKKKEINFGTDSPIENKKFTFDNKTTNMSLGSEIKRIEQNDYPDLEETNSKMNNNNNNESNMFHFDYGDEIKKSERKLSKDTFNFNTTVNQKEGDEWDF